LYTKSAEYYGGHKPYLAGGVFGKFKTGEMKLTERHLIFEKSARNTSKKIDILIPLNSVIIEDWHVLSESRRKEVSGLGGSDNFGLGGAFVHDRVVKRCCPNLVKEL
jgi:hypothetical protein